MNQPRKMSRKNESKMKVRMPTVCKEFKYSVCILDLHEEN